MTAQGPYCARSTIVTTLLREKMLVCVANSRLAYRLRPAWANHPAGELLLAGLGIARREHAAQDELDLMEDHQGQDE